MRRIYLDYTAGIADRSRSRLAQAGRERRDSQHAKKNPNSEDNREIDKAGFRRRRQIYSSARRPITDVR